MKIIVILECGVVRNVFTNDSADIEVVDCDALNRKERARNEKRFVEVKRMAADKDSTLIESWDNTKALHKKLGLVK